MSKMRRLRQNRMGRNLIEKDVNKMSWKERAEKLKNWLKQEESNRLIDRREEMKKLKEKRKERKLLYKEYGRRIKNVCKPFARSIKGKLWPSSWDTTNGNYIAMYGEGPPKRFEIRGPKNKFGLRRHIEVRIDVYNECVVVWTHRFTDSLSQKCEDLLDYSMYISPGGTENAVYYSIPFYIFTEDKLAAVIEEFLKEALSA